MLRYRRPSRADDRGFAGVAHERLPDRYGRACIQGGDRAPHDPPTHATETVLERVAHFGRFDERARTLQVDPDAAGGLDERAAHCHVARAADDIGLYAGNAGVMDPDALDESVGTAGDTDAIFDGVRTDGEAADPVPLTSTSTTAKSPAPPDLGKRWAASPEAHGFVRDHDVLEVTALGYGDDGAGRGPNTAAWIVVQGRAIVPSLSTPAYDASTNSVVSSTGVSPYGGAPQGTTSRQLVSPGSASIPVRTARTGAQDAASPPFGDEAGRACVGRDTRCDATRRALDRPGVADREAAVRRHRFFRSAARIPGSEQKDGVVSRHHPSRYHSRSLRASLVMLLPRMRNRASRRAALSVRSCASMTRSFVGASYTSLVLLLAGCVVTLDEEHTELVGVPPVDQFPPPGERSHR